MKGIVQSYPLNPLPDDLYEGLAEVVEGEGTDIERLQKIYNSTLMKPTLCTFNFENPFPVNSCTKIARLTLTDEAIDDSIEDIEGKLLALQGMPFQETIVDRIDLYREVFLDDAKIDRFRLGVMEIYGDNTYYNVQKDPRVSMTMYWRNQESGDSRSYQVNAIAEIVEPGTPFFRYMRVLRSLFSSQFVETRRGEYVAAYKLWISELHDKSLVSKTGFVPSN
jgi:hypothetical protein